MMRPTIILLALLLMLLVPLPGSAQPQPQPTDEMVLGSTEIPPDVADSVVLPLKISNSVAISAFSAGFLVDPTFLSVDNLFYSGPIEPEFIGVGVGIGGGSIGVVFSIDLSSVLPPGAHRTMVQVEISFPANIPLGVHEVELGPFGTPPIDAEFSTVTGGVILPETTDGLIVAFGSQAPGTIPNRFRLALTDGGSPGIFFRTLTLDGSTASEAALPPPTQGELEVIALATDGNGNSVCLAREASVTGVLGQLFVGRDPQLNNFNVATLGEGDFTALAVSSRGLSYVGDFNGGVSVVAPDGQLIYGNNGLLGDPITFTSGPIRALALSPGGGSLWVCAGDHLYRVTSATQTAVDSDLGAGTLPSALATFRDSTVVVALRGTGTIEHRAADGSLIADYPLGAGAQPTGIVIMGGGSNCMTAVDYVSGTAFRVELGIGVVDSFSIGPGGNGVTVDGDGQLWVSAASATGGGTLTAYDSDGGVITSLQFFGEVPTINGEASGMPLAIVYERDVDEDGDGYSNGLETDAGSNPFDAISDPVSVDDTFVPPLSALGSIIFTPIGGSDSQVALNWAWSSPLAGSSDGFEVSRIVGGFSEVLNTVSGDETGFVDSNPPAAAITYEVVAILGGNASAGRTTTVVLGAGQQTSSFPIAFPGIDDPEPFDITDGPAANTFLGTDDAKYYVTDVANGVIYKLDENLQVLGVLPSPFEEGVPLSGIAFDPTGDGGNGSLMVGNGLSGVQTVWKEIDLTGGVLETYFLTEDTSPILGAHSGKTGGIAYCKEADMFYGIGPEGCQILGMAGDSSPPGELDNDQSGTHPSAGSSQAGITVKACTIDNNPFGAQLDTILYLTSALPGGGLQVIEVDIGTNSDGVVETGSPPISLGGIDNPAGVFFEDGYLTVISSSPSSGTTVQVTAPFVRGDANFDGVVDLADPIKVLGYLFLGAALDFECTEALNANDDGTVNLADGVFLLTYLFVNDLTPPPTPFPDPGIDPTPGGDPNSDPNAAIPYCLESQY